MGLIDLTGMVFNELTVIELAEITHDHRAKWRCVCVCGKETVVFASGLKAGTTRSCGCWHRAQFKKLATTHGKSKSEEYGIWQNMKCRCMLPKSTGYENYGGRGIKVCDRWLNSFENFLADMGPRPSKNHSIDRYPDVNGHYEPENVRWATKKEQSANVRNNLWVVFRGERMVYTEFWRRLGIKSNHSFNLIKKGWTADQIEEHYIKKGVIK